MTKPQGASCAPCDNLNYKDTDLGRAGTLALLFYCALHSQVSKRRLISRSFAQPTKA